MIAFCTFEKNYSFHNLKVLITSWLIVIISIGLGLLPMLLYYCFKLCYVLNHYQEFLCYEVLLEHFSTSFSYRHSVYYTVTISCDGITKKIDTNSYFSSGIFSIFSPEEFNHQFVIGLYDERLEKFYIIKKIN